MTTPIAAVIQPPTVHAMEMPAWVLADELFPEFPEEVDYNKYQVNVTLQSPE